MSCETARDWIAEQGGGNVLTLYGTKICTFRYFTNDGSKQIGGDFSAYEGTEIAFRNLRTRKIPCTEDGASIKTEHGVWGGFGRSYIMDEDRNLYLVEYARITFKDYNGSTNSSYEKMEKIVKKGSAVFASVCSADIKLQEHRLGENKKYFLAVYGSRDKNHGKRTV